MCGGSYYTSNRHRTEPRTQTNGGKVRLVLEIEVHDEHALDEYLAGRWRYGMRPPDEYAGSRYEPEEGAGRMPLAEKVLEALVQNNENPPDADYGIELRTCRAYGSDQHTPADADHL